MECNTHPCSEGAAIGRGKHGCWCVEARVDGNEFRQATDDEERNTSQCYKCWINRQMYEAENTTAKHVKCKISHQME